MRDIGLPPGVVYAGLAETITLALEGRFEVFTVGASPQWDKVREIYRLGLKHGMQLAAISGVDGIYSEEEIARVSVWHQGAQSSMIFRKWRNLSSNAGALLGERWSGPFDQRKL
jgi:hypothetical protein